MGDRIDQIPRLYAYFSQNGQFYLVQEYVEGQTLTQKIQQQGIFSESAVRDILINILPVLDFIHSHRMVHRDIKPDNIILRFSDGKPALIDFGAVKETMGTVMTPSGNSTRSIVIGTPGFMPMEQSVGRPVFSSDIYSLGLTAIYLLTGKMPPELATDPGTGELMWRHSALNISPTLGAVLDKTVQQSPPDRYYSAREMLAALQTPVTPPPPTVPVPPPSGNTAPPSVEYMPPPPTVPPTPMGNGQSMAVSTSGLGTWQQAVIIGSVIGVIVIGGLWMMQILGQNSNSQITTTNPSPEVTSTPEPIDTPTSTPQPTRTFQPSSTARISRSAAVRVVQQWIRSKEYIFGPSYRTDLGTEILTGIAYTNNIKKPMILMPVLLGVFGKIIV